MNNSERLRELADKLETGIVTYAENHTKGEVARYLNRHAVKSGRILSEAIESGVVGYSVERHQGERDEAFYNRVFLELSQQWLPTICPEVGGRGMRYPDDDIDPEGVRLEARFSYPMRAFADYLEATSPEPTELVAKKRGGRKPDPSTQVKYRKALRLISEGTTNAAIISRMGVSDTWISTLVCWHKMIISEASRVIENDDPISDSEVIEAIKPHLKDKKNSIHPTIEDVQIARNNIRLSREDVS